MHVTCVTCRLYTVVPYLVKFIDNLTNIYVRFNRKRLKGRNGREDSLMALATLFDVLLTVCKVRRLTGRGPQAGVVAGRRSAALFWSSRMTESPGYYHACMAWVRLHAPG